MILLGFLAYSSRRCQQMFRANLKVRCTVFAEFSWPLVNGNWNAHILCQYMAGLCCNLQSLQGHSALGLCSCLKDLLDIYCFKNIKMSMHPLTQNHFCNNFIDNTKQRQSIWRLSMAHDNYSQLISWLTYTAFKIFHVLQVYVLPQSSIKGFLNLIST